VSFSRKFQNTTQNLPGLQLERNALSALPPETPYGDDGLTVGGRISDLARQTSEIAALSQRFSPALLKADLNTLEIYALKEEKEGYINAIRWFGKTLEEGG
jgi:hypothetical protein